jgi:hypothetical protein
MLVDLEYHFFGGSFGLEFFCTCVKNINMFLLQKSHVKKKFFNPWEGVKVGSSVGTNLEIAQGDNFGVTPPYNFL